MLYKTLSAAVYGIDASIIEVEVDVSGVKCDEDHFHTVGLPDAAVRESASFLQEALSLALTLCMFPKRQLAQWSERFQGRTECRYADSRAWNPGCLWWFE